LLAFRDRDGTLKRWAMPMAMLATDGAELREELFSQGMEIASTTGARRHLLNYIQWANPDTKARCVSCTGWQGVAFALPDRTYNDHAESIIYQAASLEGITLAQGGTLDGWRDEVARPCEGNSRLVLAISTGFAGPCLGLAQAEGGGLHLRGSSSVGKSTALLVAGSIFGPPSFVRTWRQTDNALEGVARLHSDLLLILDEIGELDPKHAANVAYMLANGQGKGRANRSGEARASARWRVLFLSSGEVSLGDLVMQSGGIVRAGHEVRVMDLPADAGKGLGLFDRVPTGIAPGAFADRLKTAAATHYGYALLAFLERLTSNVDTARAILTEGRDKLAMEWAKGTDDGQVRRVAQRFALIAAAGELATHYGVTGWKADEAEQAARTCFAAWLNARGTKGNAEPVAMVSAVRAFLEAHGDSRFTDWDASNDDRTRTINRAGFRKNTSEGVEYYIETEAFKREVAKGLDHKAVAKALADCSALVAGSDGRLTSKPRLPGVGTRWVYRITPKLWEIEL
jgi:putative DNA primase/helicase